MAFSLSCTAASARVCEFCKSATIRNVTIVVAVLMINCQVSSEPITKYDGAHTTTSRTHSAKNHAREKNIDATVAKRSNTPNRPETSDGMCAVSDSTTVLATATLPSSRHVTARVEPRPDSAPVPCHQPP